MWFESYLRNRWQYIQINEYKSSTFVANSGVPQGSHCGPTLFNIVMNLIPQLLPNIRFLFYADDAKLVFPIKSSEDCVILQQMALSFHTVCKQLGLELNISKCKVMTFSKARSPIHYEYTFANLAIERVERINDLGVIFNSNFTFKDDLSHRIAKAKSMIGFIKRQATEFKDPMVLRSLYFAFVRSKLEYCSQVWNCYQSLYYGEINGIRCLIDKIEKIQVNFIQFLTRNNNFLINMNYKDRCTYFDIDSLKNRRMVNSALMCFDILTGNIDCPELLAELNINCVSTHVILSSNILC